MATNPPITIGPFSNVPAPGSGVKSDWPQQISNVVNGAGWGTVVAPQVSNSFFATVAPHTTYQDTGMVLTFAPVAGRRYRFTYTTNPYLPGGAQPVITYRLIYGATVLRYWSIGNLSTTLPLWVNMQHSAVLGAIGSTTFKIQVAGGANTLLYDYGDATYLRQFTIEDIGKL